MKKEVNKKSLYGVTLSEIESIEKTLIKPTKRNCYDAEDRRAAMNKLNKLRDENKLFIRAKGSSYATQIKQRIMIKDWVQNGLGSLPESAKKAGFAPQSTSSIVKTKNWKLLMDEFLPDVLLAERHNEILNKRDFEKITDPVTKVVTLVDVGPETSAVTKGLEMAYRLKGAFTENKDSQKSTAIYNLIYKPEVKAGIKNFEDMLKAQLYGETNTNIKQIESENVIDAGGERGDPDYDPNYGVAGEVEEDKG